MPFVVRTSLPVLRGIDPGLLEAAATLGASPLRAWRTSTVPHLRRPLVVAAGLAAAISLGEFGATSFLSRSGSETMPIAIERLLGRTGALLQAQGYALADDPRRRDGGRRDAHRSRCRPADDRRRADPCSRSTTSPSRSAARRCSTDVHARPSPTARSSPCSGRRAAARARCCGSIAGLLLPDAGAVRLDGVDVTAVPTHRRGVGMVFQDEQLFPHRDVGGQRRLRAAHAPHRAGAAPTRRVAELLALVGLAGFGRAR